MEKYEPHVTISFTHLFIRQLSLYTDSYEFLTSLNLDVLANKNILQVAPEMKILGVC